MDLTCFEKIRFVLILGKQKKLIERNEELLILTRKMRDCLGFFGMSQKYLVINYCRLLKFRPVLPM